MRTDQSLSQRVMRELAKGPATNIRLREELAVKERDLCLACGHLLLSGGITARLEPGRRIVITYAIRRSELRAAA